MQKKFKIEDIKEDTTFKKFLNKKKGLKPSTIEGYTFALLDFCKIKD
ncbi:MAG: hypothetical protein ACXVHW_10405 [Methanobacterium sp.]